MTRDTRLEGQMVEIAFRLAELERRARNRNRTGTVVSVDHAAGKAVVRFSDQAGRPYEGPAMPWKEVAAGGIRSHIPPSVGEQVTVTSESGDLGDGIIDLSVPSTAHPRPHDGPEAVITLGGSRIQIGDAAIELTTPTLRIVGDVAIEGRVAITGAAVTHNRRSIGDDHRHTDVFPGGGISGPPQVRGS